MTTSEISTSAVSARVTRVEVPVASPGACVLCGKNEHPDGFAATDNLDFEFYGTVYFCADCIGDYARLFGYMSPKVAEVIETKVSDLTNEVATLRQAVVLMENTIDNLTSLSGMRASGALPVAGDVSDAVDDAELTDQQSQGITDSGESDEHQVNQSSEQSRRDDVHDLTTTVDELLGEL